MNLELLFTIANSTAVIGWLILAILNDHPLTKKIILNGIITALAIFYAFLLIYSSGVASAGNMFSLEGVVTIFSHPIIALLGWVHYLAFDLAIGLFITFNAAKHGINRFLMLPVLFLTLFYGPFGFLVYLIILAIKQKTPMPTFF